MTLTFNPTLVRREGGCVGDFLPCLQLCISSSWCRSFGSWGKPPHSSTFFTASQWRKKPDKKHKRKKKKIYSVFNNLLDYDSKFWDLNSTTGTWEGLFRICRIHFSISVHAHHSIYLNLKLKLNPVHPFSIKAKLQPKERNKWIQSLQFCPRNMTKPTYPLHLNQTWGSSSFFLRIASGSKTSDW